MGRLGVGLVHVYTGKGKGKTTAAFGLAIRALGEGLKVLIVQFLKGRVPLTGEAALTKIMTRGGSARIIRFVNEEHPMFLPKKGFDEDKLREQIKKDFSLTKGLIMNGNYDLVILDEINNVIKGSWLSVDEVKDLIKKRPKNVEIVLTGRDAPKEIIEMADYVTEMKSIKHPSGKGIKARRGIEF
jgi:cob(I)alamin adenosyltransferase